MPMHAKAILPRGFTFIEMLAVLLIFSIIFLFISLKPQYFMDKEVKLQKTATFMVDQLKLLQQEAMLLQICNRLKVSDEGYIVERYEVQGPKSGWVTLNRDPGFKKEVEIDKLYMELTGESKEKVITFFPNGSLTPFSLKISQRDKEAFYIITGDKLGQIAMSHYVK
jgi:prepilin-type N-terminal cleavage/methylation domain-containing protein